MSVHCSYVYNSRWVLPVGVTFLNLWPSWTNTVPLPLSYYTCLITYVAGGGGGWMWYVWAQLYGTSIRIRSCISLFVVEIVTHERHIRCGEKRKSCIVWENMPEHRIPKLLYQKKQKGVRCQGRETRRWKEQGQSLVLVHECWYYDVSSLVTMYQFWFVGTAV